MRLDRARCGHLLGQSERGVLATSHPTRGVDAVPVCFAVEGSRLAVPVDRVKPKASVDLQRIRNLDQDPRAALLCDHWDLTDWSRLWWVRASIQRVASGSEEQSSLESLLRNKYRQYVDHPFATLLVFRIDEVIGWSARSDGEAAP
jgi:PPOX class probable F420-dependent enzyme